MYGILQRNKVRTKGAERSLMLDSLRKRVKRVTLLCGQRKFQPFSPRAYTLVSLIYTSRKRRVMMAW